MPRVVPVLALLILVLSSSVSATATDASTECPLRITRTTPTDRVMDARPDVSVTVDAACVHRGVSATLVLDGRVVTPLADGNAFTFTPRDALAPGPHVAHARVEDAHGNVAHATWSFIMHPLDAPGARVIAHAPGPAGARELPLPVRDAALRVDGAWARPTADAHDLTVTVQRLRALPPDVTAPPADPLALVTVDARARVGPVTGGVASFAPGFRALTLRASVPLDVLAAESATPAQVHALAFVDGAWTRLPTRDASVNVTHARVNVTLQNPAPVALVVDSRAPVVHALAPAHAAAVTTPPVVRASVTENVDLASVRVTVNDRVIATPRGAASALVDAPTAPHGLDDGWHTITVRAVDGSGNTAERAWSFVLDRAPPTFPRVHADARAGFTVDYVDALSGVRSGSVRLTLDGVDVTPLARVTPTHAAFTPAKPLAAGEHVMVVTVTDHAGNAADTRHAFTLPVAATPFPALALALVAVAAALALTRRP